MKLYITYHGKDMIRVSDSLDCLPAETALVQWTKEYTAEEVSTILTLQGYNVCIDTSLFFQDYKEDIR